MVIDTWLLAVFFLCLLILLALVRILRIRSFYDRIAATIVALCLAGAIGLLASISLGSLLVLNSTLVVVLVCFALIVVRLHTSRGERA